jgi:hypothetical protein
MLIKRSKKKQSGHTHIQVDLTLKAIPPGLRKSKSGKFYWETRKNRSDVHPEKMI